MVGILVRRGADFASAEDAVQTALVRALERSDLEGARDLRAWLVTVAWHAFIDQVRSDAARTARQERVATEPEPGAVPQRDDTLALYFLCTHPALTSTSAIALTLRAVAGLTTRQIADAFLVSEATMAQRISRAKQRLVGVALDQPAISPACCACSTCCSTTATPARSMWSPKRSASRGSSPRSPTSRRPTGSSP
ncbi:sigma factor [Agrococcus sp. Ld7]|uniref:sigma factor n=1 Tax=Agrococcus sp. Ld7 TaxID=649148 RepID=UPI003864EC25